MKNNMKKLIVGFLSFVLLFVGQSAFGANIWNTASNDCPTINVANFTTNTGFGTPCWTGTNINANPGETINVRIYYHNTSNATATNTYIKLNAPNGSSTNHSFSAQISSPQGNLSSGSVSVNIPSSQTLTFGSTRWYPNQTQTAATFLNGQSGSEVIGSNGLYIGNIAPGWSTQGSVVVSFKVSNSNTPSCAITNFSANPSSITSGTSSTLNWSTNNCSSVVISPNVGSVSLNGSQSVYPTQTTIYTIKAYNGAGVLADTDNVTVTVNSVIPSCSIDSFTANPSTIASGSSSTLNWSTTNCASVTISNLGYNVPTVGSQLVYPTQTTIYTIKAYNGAGVLADTDNVTVTVNSVIPSCSIDSFTANPSTIASGSSSTLNWSTTNCASVTISNLGYNVPTVGSQLVYPTQTTTYTLKAYDSNGGNQTRSVTITVRQNTQTCSIDNFTADPQSINSGGSSILNWKTTNCISVSLDYAEIQTSGSKEVHPTQTTTYTLRANSTNEATQTRTTTVIVNNNTNSCTIKSFYADPTNITSDESSILYWETENCNSVSLDGTEVSTSSHKTVSPNSTQTYTLRASGASIVFNNTKTAQATVYVDENNNLKCSIDSYTASDTKIKEGDHVNLKWRTSNCDKISISNLDNNLPEDGSDNVYPRQTTTYTLRASGNGSESRSIRIDVDRDNIGGYYPPVVYNTNVVTTVATNVSQTGAQLNGLMTNLSCNNSSTFFDYGTSVNLGMRTASRMTNGVYFSEYITNLNSNTIYFFRAVVEGSNCSSQGAIEVFQTLKYNTNTNTNTKNVQTIRQVVYQGTTVSGSESPIVLRIENRYQAIGVGDIIDYVVFYKNISSSRLTHPMVQVFIPKGITLLNASRGTYSEADRILSTPIEDLEPNAEGVIYIQARVDTIDSTLAQIVTTTVLVYTNPNGAQENAMAYVLNNPKNVNLLGASAFFGNMFGLGLIGWLLLIIIILLLILASRSYYNRRNVIVTPTHTTLN